MSYKRTWHDRHQIQSSSVSYIDNINNFFSINPDNTININSGGEGVIWDRTIDQFQPRRRKVRWEPTYNIPTFYPAFNIIYVNKFGQVSVLPSGSAKLLNYSINGIDQNNVLQIAGAERTSTPNVNPVASGALIQYFYNLGNMYSSSMDTVGPINSLVKPVDISLNSGLTTLNIASGIVNSRNGNSLSSIYTLNANNLTVPTVSTAPIITANRLNTPIASGITLNVTNYEPTDGVIDILGNGNYGNRYLFVFQIINL